MLTKAIIATGILAVIGTLATCAMPGADPVEPVVAGPLVYSADERPRSRHHQREDQILKHIHALEKQIEDLEERLKP